MWIDTQIGIIVATRIEADQLNNLPLKYRIETAIRMIFKRL